MDSLANMPITAVLPTYDPIDTMTRLDQNARLNEQNERERAKFKVDYDPQKLAQEALQLELINRRNQALAIQAEIDNQTREEANLADIYNKQTQGQYYEAQAKTLPMKVLGDYKKNVADALFREQEAKNKTLEEVTKAAERMGKTYENITPKPKGKGKGGETDGSDTEMLNIYEQGRLASNPNALAEYNARQGISQDGETDITSSVTKGLQNNPQIKGAQSSLLNAIQSLSSRKELTNGLTFQNQIDSETQLTNEAFNTQQTTRYKNDIAQQKQVEAFRASQDKDPQTGQINIDAMMPSINYLNAIIDSEKNPTQRQLYQKRLSDTIDFNMPNKGQEIIDQANLIKDEQQRRKQQSLAYNVLATAGKTELLPVVSQDIIAAGFPNKYAGEADAVQDAFISAIRGKQTSIDDPILSKTTTLNPYLSAARIASKNGTVPFTIEDVPGDMDAKTQDRIVISGEGGITTRPKPTDPQEVAMFRLALRARDKMVEQQSSSQMVQQNINQAGTQAQIQAQAQTPNPPPKEEAQQPSRLPGIEETDFDKVDENTKVIPLQNGQGNITIKKISPEISHIRLANGEKAIERKIGNNKLMLYSGVDFDSAKQRIAESVGRNIQNPEKRDIAVRDAMAQYDKDYKSVASKQEDFTDMRDYMNRLNELLTRAKGVEGQEDVRPWLGSRTSLLGKKASEIKQMFGWSSEATDRYLSIMDELSSLQSEAAMKALGDKGSKLMDTVKEKEEMKSIVLNPAFDATDIQRRILQLDRLTSNKEQINELEATLFGQGVTQVGINPTKMQYKKEIKENPRYILDANNELVPNPNYVTANQWLGLEGRDLPTEKKNQITNPTQGQLQTSQDPENQALLAEAQKGNTKPAIEKIVNNTVNNPQLADFYKEQDAKESGNKSDEKLDKTSLFDRAISGIATRGGAGGFLSGEAMNTLEPVAKDITEGGIGEFIQNMAYDTMGSLGVEAMGGVLDMATNYSDEQIDAAKKAYYEARDKYQLDHPTAAYISAIAGGVAGGWASGGLASGAVKGAGAATGATKYIGGVIEKARETTPWFNNLMSKLVNTPAKTITGEVIGTESTAIPSTFTSSATNVAKNVAGESLQNVFASTDREQGILGRAVTGAGNALIGSTLVSAGKGAVDLGKWWSKAMLGATDPNALSKMLADKGISIAQIQELADYAQKAIDNKVPLISVVPTDSPIYRLAKDVSKYKTSNAILNDAKKVLQRQTEESIVRAEDALTKEGIDTTEVGREVTNQQGKEAIQNKYMTEYQGKSQEEINRLRQGVKEGRQEFAGTLTGQTAQDAQTFASKVAKNTAQDVEKAVIHPKVASKLEEASKLQKEADDMLKNVESDSIVEDTTKGIERLQKSNDAYIEAAKEGRDRVVKDIKEMPLPDGTDVDEIFADLEKQYGDKVSKPLNEVKENFKGTDITKLSPEEAVAYKAKREETLGKAKADIEAKNTEITKQKEANLQELEAQRKELEKLNSQEPVSVSKADRSKLNEIDDKLQESTLKLKEMKRNKPTAKGQEVTDAIDADSVIKTKQIQLDKATDKVEIKNIKSEINTRKNQIKNQVLSDYNAKITEQERAIANIQNEKTRLGNQIDEQDRLAGTQAKQTTSERTKQIKAQEAKIRELVKKQKELDNAKIIDTENVRLKEGEQPQNLNNTRVLLEGYYKIKENLLKYNTPDVVTDVLTNVRTRLDNILGKDVVENGDKLYREGSRIIENANIRGDMLNRAQELFSKISNGEVDAKQGKGLWNAIVKDSKQAKELMGEDTFNQLQKKFIGLEESQQVITKIKNKLASGDEAYIRNQLDGDLVKANYATAKDKIDLGETILKSSPSYRNAIMKTLKGSNAPENVVRDSVAGYLINNLEKESVQNMLKNPKELSNIIGNDTVKLVNTLSDAKKANKQLIDFMPKDVKEEEKWGWFAESTIMGDLLTRDPAKWQRSIQRMITFGRITNREAKAYSDLAEILFNPDASKTKIGVEQIAKPLKVISGSNTARLFIPNAKDTDKEPDVKYISNLIARKLTMKTQESRDAATERRRERIVRTLD